MEQNWNTANHGQRNMQDANIPTANFWKVNSLEEAKKLFIHHLFSCSES